MPANTYAAMMAYQGFDETDRTNLTGLRGRIGPLLPRVADRFYESIRNYPEAARMFTGGADQIAKHRIRVLDWLEALFSGQYTANHFAESVQIGHTHVDISLPQHYMVTGMAVIQEELVKCVREVAPADAESRIQSLNRLLAVELGSMLEAYKTLYSARIRHDEREAMEERLTKAEHMAHLGQLAASLAHAIKNPLAGISGAIQVIRGNMAEGNPHRTVVDEMLAQIDRLDATVKDLLVYSRPRAPARISIELNELISRVLNILREEPTLRLIRVKHVRENELPRIHADERHLEQVIMNLLLNAADASNSGDEVTITTAFDGCIRMKIADNGIGMTPEVLNRAFEPFHTTKTKGTGLGLPICKQIIDAHGGRISIQSKRHGGTTVVVEIPVEAPRRGSDTDRRI